MSKNEFNPVKSADRVFDIFEELIRCPKGLSKNELGQRLGIAGSSIHALILTMIHRKYVKIDEARKITLGNKFYEFVGLYTNEPLLVQAKPIMKALAQRVNENIHLAVLDGLEIVYIAFEETTHPIRYHVELGQMQLAHVTGVGKMLISQFSDKTIKEMYMNVQFKKLTENTIDSTDMLIERITSIRSLGYSLDDGEAYVGSKCFAGPIYDANHQMVASLSISIPFVRIEQDRDEEMIAMVKEACNQITLNLKNI